MKKKLLLFFILLLAGCSSNLQEDTVNSTEGLAEVNEMTLNEQGDMREETDLGLIGEKVIKTVYLDYETLAYEDSQKYLLEKIADFKAYIEYSTESNNGLQNETFNNRVPLRQVHYTLRVPTENLNAFLDALSGMNAVKTSRQIGAEDATKNYRDIEARINVLNQKEVRLQELLEDAETVEQLLLIEDNLSETIAEREILQSQLDNIDDLIDYTQVYVQLSEKQRLSQNPGQAVSFWQRVKHALLDSLYSFYYWMQDAAVWLIYALPYILILGFLITLFIVLYKRFIAKKKR